MQVLPPVSWQAVGAVSGLLGTVLTLLVAWIKDRTAISRRIQLLDEATRYVAFWKAFMESATNTLPEDEAASLARLYATNLKLLAEYVEYGSTQPIRQSVDDAPLKWVHRETLKQKAKGVARTWGFATGIIFVLLWAIKTWLPPMFFQFMGISASPSSLR
jgi:hypothetical protein